ncbi:MAG: ornithine carbamoyltransferase [Candidatus Marsarchaeota archaeon]|jgi:ornithine carbamoyltransferase|uniref:Ornithine carbamoyltransferase n=1 Tax=Candidatus Micrarchaeum acidiphilum ARMAN-2 TaxID=425595 RepID=C7DHW8_MICA2|nr:MAG: ornithine carbamoyltransferase [Candidatus Micrarchaeum acidiphilum ARMAN-2]MCL4410988.1 ornithine carbamoyltransferase [Candidatus Marsarchaeota archaeon]MCL5434525.1 ornithine carbamoyltransferase [Candidatus Marsarchaeota archaeon]MCW6160789.1 ornithine carbamoyltransferase [Candidatus Micrarchaeales archaeon]
MNILSSNDLDREQIEKIFNLADKIKENKEELSLKENSILALFFEKASTRTRTSFEAAITQLGGKGIYIDAQTSQLKRGEPISDIARMLSSYCDFIAARLYSHSDLVSMAEHSSVPVINALTDLEHPTQALVDMYTVLEYKRNPKNVKIAFVGDIATNTANSLMITAAKLGASMVLVGPKGYLPNSTYFNKAKEYGEITFTDEIEKGMEDVDIIYTDTFVSMGQEEEAEKRRKMFADYQVNSKMLEYANEDVLVMHCLPAHRGEEITGEVIDGPKSIVWEQAKNKLLIAKAVLLFLSQSNR